MFDAIICECAFCTSPDKPAAAAEFARVIRRGGRVGLSNLTRIGPRQAGDRTLTFRCEGDAIVNEETGSTWDVARGLAVDGRLKGEALQSVPN